MQFRDYAGDVMDVVKTDHPGEGARFVIGDRGVFLNPGAAILLAKELLRSFDPPTPPSTQVTGTIISK